MCRIDSLLLEVVLVLVLASAMPLGVSQRVLETSTAVIDDLIEEHGSTPGLINLAPGAPALSPSAATLQAAADAAGDNSVSAYGDVLGFEPLRKRWFEQIVQSWDAPALASGGESQASALFNLGAGELAKLELMVTGGANQVCPSLCTSELRRMDTI